jgi:hypothetical protein
MRMKLGTFVVLVSGSLLVAAVGAGAATPPQYGAKCNEAWTGKRGTPEFRVYKKACMTAALAATKAARATGDSDVSAANASRAAAACKAVSPAPRRTEAARAAHRACVSAAAAAQKAYGGRPLAATLAGVVGDATTDQDGTGTASFTLNQGRGQICYEVAWTGLGAVSALHIHAAADGAIVIPLSADAVLTDGSAKGCVSVAKALVKTVRQHPGQYYVNVHTDEFTAGAIRGTLQA